MKVKTWCPMFSGFYNTIWDGDSEEEREIEYINEQREEKKLPPIEWDDLKIDYDEYRESISKQFCQAFGDKMERFIRSTKYDNLYSPKEYNFKTDSINCTFDIKVKEIKDYLKANAEAFEDYVKERHTSCDGFISFHSNNAALWLQDKELFKDTYKIGAILEFIAIQELNDGDDFYSSFEGEVYEDITCNGGDIGNFITNFDKLINPELERGGIK